MRIDLKKLIILLLPTFLRKEILVEIFHVLIASLRDTQNRFDAQTPDWRYRICSNASVLSLQKTIKRELDIDATIKELEGKSVDFLVTAIGNVDERRLRSVIQANKLAGKSFIFQTGNDTFEAKFIGHVCELSFIENLIRANIDSAGHIWAISEHPVYEEIKVNMTAFSYSKSKSYYVTIQADTRESDHIAAQIGGGETKPPFSSVEPVTSTAITSISVKYDTWYKYIFSEEPVSIWDN